MKLLLLLLFFLLGIISCSPTAEVYITPELMGSDKIELAAPSSDRRLSFPAAEIFDSGVQGEEVNQTTKDQIETVPPLISVEHSPDVSLIHPAGVIDLRELDVGNIEIEDKRMEEMPNPQLVEPIMVEPNMVEPITTLVEEARQELANKLGIDFGAVSLVSLAVVESPYDKINCQTNSSGRRPLIVTFAHLITLKAAGKEYNYHAEPCRVLSLCEEG